MPFRSVPNRWLMSFTIVALGYCATLAQEKQKPPGQSEDIVRVETALVQTDVMVFDKQGKFVAGLKPEQFVLKVDGKQRDISFFEKVEAGTSNEEVQLAAARGKVAANGTIAPVPLDRGRVVFFFIDDLHLSIDSMNRARALLKRFVDHEMGQNDQAGFVSTTGQLGFLQQLADNKKVLLTALDRLTPRPFVTRDLQTPPMSEYQALMIDRNDNDVVDYFVDALLRENPMLGRVMAEQEVHARSLAMLQVAASATTNTLSALKKAIEFSAPLPGRKLLFLVSDGFFLDNRNSDAFDRLRHIASAAAASGIVIYSIDARGLATGGSDAATPIAFDPSGRLSRAGSGELSASQDALNALAADTGGRAFFNSNLLSAALTTALKETSVYYLLAWRPQNEEQRNAKFRRIEVSVVGRPELFVRFRRGFGDVVSSDNPDNGRNKSATPVKPEEQIRAALRSPYAKTGLSISLSLNFLNTPQRGDVIISSIKIAPAQLVFESQAGMATANVALTGIIFDDRGKVVDTFDKRITLRANSAAETSRPPNIYYNNYSAIRPGLYQVRVAAIDEKGGPAGSTWQWIDIPDLSTKNLSLSSIIVGERRTTPETQPATPDVTEKSRVEALLPQVNLNVDHHFSRSSYLRLLTFVYNAANSTAAPVAGNTSAAPSPKPENKLNSPDLAVQVQVFRDNEPVITDPLHRINTDGVNDLTRLPYAAELSLATLQPGRYVLQITVIDRLARASAAQRFNFEVD